MQEQPQKTQSSTLRYIDLEKQIWREIYLLLDLKYLKTRIKDNAKVLGEKIGDDYATQKAKDIQFCIKQAKDYFNSSKTSTLITKPTLIYYGLISLISALIIFKKRDKCLNSMRESHGLKDFYPETIKQLNEKNISKNQILEICAEIQESGTFVELSEMDLFERFQINKRSGNSNTSQDFKQRINLKNDYPNIKKVTLLSLFQNIPEIWKELRLSINKPSNVFLAEAIIDEDKLAVRFLKELIDAETIKSHFSFAKKLDIIESNDYFFCYLSKNEYYQDLPLAKRDVTGVQYLTTNKGNDFIANDLITYYLTFFILGSISRYKPALWRFILEDMEKGLNTIPEILCESAYIKIPLAFISELNDNFYKY